jgi:hypothetical protein
MAQWSSVMVASKVPSRKSAQRGSQATSRHAWLAALGVFAVARREASTMIEIAREETGRLRDRAIDLAGDARAIARGGVITLIEKAEPLVEQFNSEVGARLAPVLDKLGFAASARRAPRTTRKPARKTAKPASVRRSVSRNTPNGRAPAKKRG